MLKVQNLHSAQTKPGVLQISPNHFNSRFSKRKLSDKVLLKIANTYSPSPLEKTAVRIIPEKSVLPRGMSDNWPLLTTSAKDLGGWGWESCSGVTGLFTYGCLGLSKGWASFPASSQNVPLDSDDTFSVAVVPGFLGLPVTSANIDFSTVWPVGLIKFPIQ